MPAEADRRRLPAHGAVGVRHDVHVAQALGSLDEIGQRLRHPRGHGKKHGWLSFSVQPDEAELRQRSRHLPALRPSPLQRKEGGQNERSLLDRSGQCSIRIGPVSDGPKLMHNAADRTTLSGESLALNALQQFIRHALLGALLWL